MPGVGPEVPVTKGLAPPPISVFPEPHSASAAGVSSSAVAPLIVPELACSTVTSAGPVAPVEPVEPVTPVVPVAPVGPVAPVEPVGPVGPVAPVAPVEPAPVAPAAPVAPVTPAGPRLPGGPTVFQVTASSPLEQRSPGRRMRSAPYVRYLPERVL